MQKFDCLALDVPLFGPHLLEASAGTGKTFSIEHIVVRLLLHSIELKEILAVTFTKAATRELKLRVRNNIEKALESIQAGQTDWPYLTPFLGNDLAVQKLRDALSDFDECQIFTIHGFCYRKLKEFSFEANIAEVSNPDKGKKIPEKLYFAARDFLEYGISEELLCKEQIAQLLKEMGSLDEIVSKLVETKLEKPKNVLSFSACYEQCKAALHASWGQIEEEKLLFDFEALKKNYKSAVKGDFTSQIRGLFCKKAFPQLLKERGSVFSFISKENQKVRIDEPKVLHYPGFFDWGKKTIEPFLKKKVFPILQSVWVDIAKKVMEDESLFDPDEILLQMQRAVQAGFAERLRGNYQAVIIDEFQDTDAVQWDIFQKLFFHPQIKALYFVGDPKQSIYRFRKADVYTYLQARDLLGEDAIYQLDTNFRSSEKLVSALNALFHRNWLDLPKKGGSLPYYPVKAGARIPSKINDSKGAIHCFFTEGDPAAVFEELFLPYVAKEIEELGLYSSAILVKDRYQAEKTVAFLKKRNIAAIAKNHTPLGQTESFQKLYELIVAIQDPHDKNKREVALAGDLLSEKVSFIELKKQMEERGLVFLAKQLRIHSELMQIFEHLFSWERKEGFCFEGAVRFLKELKKLKAEEGSAQRTVVNEKAVQVMTLHVSKGLEFDVVFALALAARGPVSEEEVKEHLAEKKRQLYVAMTRAKERLYIPYVICEKKVEEGGESPIELFARDFNGSFLEELRSFSASESITLEKIAPPFFLKEPLKLENKEETASCFPIRPFNASFLSSFTQLAKTHEADWEYSEPDLSTFTLQNMPRGKQTGILIHKIFEILFGTKKRSWNDKEEIERIVASQMVHTPLQPWQKVVEKMIDEVVVMPLQMGKEVFSLSQIEQFHVETPFIFSFPPDFIKGVIDLIFEWKGKIYFLDWKTNWLPDYSMASLNEAMNMHDYLLQASIYQEAIQRKLSAHPHLLLGGIFYVFIRGPASIALAKVESFEKSIYNGASHAS